MPKKCKCGRKTNDPSGMCVICTVRTRTAEKVSAKEKALSDKTETKQEGKESTMAKTKECPCGKEFEPISNRQIYCPECKEAKKPVPRKKAVKKKTAKKKAAQIVILNLPEGLHLAAL